MLALGCEDENLYPPLRGDDGAREFFAERDIEWWSHNGFDTTGRNGPTRNMASSQVMCINFMLPVAEVNGALPAAIRAIDNDVVRIIDIGRESKKSSVEFEWIGTPVSLEGKTGPRGSNNTSVDAFLIAETSSGRRAYLIEWKYIERYNRRYKSVGQNLETYSNLYSADTSSFTGEVPMDELLYDPFRQLMRLRLLADRMVARGELDVSDAKVVVVVPKGNTAYRERITSPPLAERFPHLSTVSDVFRATLKNPDRAFATVPPSLLLDAVEQECGAAASDWVAYMRERYGP